MATTTASAFDEFKKRLLLTDKQNATVTARRETVAGYLRNAFPATCDLPLRRTALIGSAGRATMIRPLVDIDLLAVFDNKDNIFGAYRYDSQAFLYRVRDALKAHSTVQVVGARGQAVRFFYSDPPHVDVAPVFSWQLGGYALPNGSGGWLTTDPDRHASYFEDRNKALEYRLKPMIRMQKRWNTVHSGYLKSFHLEVMTAKLFSSIGNDSRAASKLFFSNASYHLGVSDPAGHSGDLSTYLSSAARSNLISNLTSAAARATKANDAELAGDHKAAIGHWRIIFGDEFPAYG